MNVFVTVGAQVPFDRLVAAVDRWAYDRGRGHAFFAQIGEGGQLPAHMEHAELLEPPEFRRRVLWADALVAHAGMGSILTALQYGKPILVMPRQGRLKETRNDHQVATARRFLEMKMVAVAMDEAQMPARLDELGTLVGAERISDKASYELIEAIRSYIWTGAA